MLTGEQVLAMIEAGFTAEEIRSYQAPETPPEDPATEAQEETTEDPVEDPADPAYVPREEFDALKGALDQLTKQIQANNVLLASKETPPKQLTVEEAADAAIKAFFNS